jgi:DNA-binding transcriptional regulator YiaG
MGERVTKKSKREFAEMLIEWRDRKGFTQAQAAEHLGTSIDNIQNWERARYRPRGVALNALVSIID